MPSQAIEVVKRSSRWVVRRWPLDAVIGSHMLNVSANAFRANSGAWLAGYRPRNSRTAARRRRGGLDAGTTALGVTRALGRPPADVGCLSRIHDPEQVNHQSR